MSTATKRVLTSSASTEFPIPQTTPDRFRSLECADFDVIVIGAGMGGLTAAALLAKRGRSVLVLDRHFVAGGNATVFHRRDYQFDVGIHYLGDCSPTGNIPRILHAAGIDDVVFRELDPDGFDTLVFPGFSFRVPKGVENFRARLLEHFPNEARGIERYCGMLRDVGSLQKLWDGGFAQALHILWQTRKSLWYLNGTLQRFLEATNHVVREVGALLGQQLQQNRAAQQGHSLVF